MATVTAELEYQGQRYTVTTPLSDNHDPAGVHWHWTEGNFGCDCNRMLFINDAYDDFPLDPDEDGWFACGHTVKLVSLMLDGKDIIAPTTKERLAAIGLIGL